jgi:hypothetical protein
MLSDCRSAAPVTRDGAIDRWPSPRFHSPSAFSALLDPDAADAASALTAAERPRVAA